MEYTATALTPMYLARRYCAPFLRAVWRDIGSTEDMVNRLVAQAMLAAGVKPGYSTAIDEVTITRGYGELDANGFWEFPLPGETHDCLSRLVWREAEWTETHGLDCGPYEHGVDAWWECAICHDVFTEREAGRLRDAG